MKTRTEFNPWHLLALAAVALFFIAPDIAFASTASTGMPWEGPIQKIVKSFTGPVAYGASALGVVGAGLVLIFKGGELTDTMQKLLQVVMGLSLMLGATTFVRSLFSSSSVISAALGQ